MVFWTVFWGKGDYIDVLIIKNMIKTNQIDMNVCFFSNVDNILLSPSVYRFVNSALTDKHGAINLQGLICPCFLCHVELLTW